MRLTDIDSLKKTFHDEWDEVLVFDESGEVIADEACRIIDDAPTIDAVPVKHGHWEVNPYDRSYDVCSACGIGSKRREYGTNPDGSEYVTEWSWNYCPNCGAKMEEVEK